MATENPIFFNSLDHSSDLASDSSEPELRLRFPVWAVCIMTFTYAVVFIFGVVGNCSVIIVVARLPRLRNITNLFVCNLAIADFLVLVFCLVPNLISNIFIEWTLGFYLCKTVPYIQGVSVCASVYSLVAISVERLVTTRRPFSPRMTTRTASFVILLIWIWSCIVALPWALFFRTGPLDPNYPGLIFCVEVWPERFQSWSAYYFLVGNFLICYLLPLCIILFSYLLIFWTLYSRRRQASAQLNAAIENLDMLHWQSANVVVVKTLLVIVCIFFLTWLPLYCINLRLKFFSSRIGELESSLIEIFYPVAQLFGHVGSAANPFVYGFRKREFISGLKDIIMSEPDRTSRSNANDQERSMGLELQ